MRVKDSFFYLLFLISAVCISAEETVHVIQRGDTIYSIARSYGVRVEDVLSLNGMTDTDVLRIQVGQRIKIPGGFQISVPAAAFKEHRVAKGETFYGIARTYGITLQALRTTNEIAENYVLKAGDVLRIPLPAAAGTPEVSPAPPPVERSNPAAGTVTRSVEPRKVDASIVWPVRAQEVSYMTGKLNGVVVLGEKSESIRNIVPGTVVSAGPYRGFGKVAIIQVTGGYLYVYGGCESLSVKVGDRVASGTELGKLGIDAVSEKPQLFFMVYRNNNPIDPARAPRA
ncbi:MAG: M23 family metallopeptidase [Spirochaetaceae bacterium]|jgi:murein DD-endopeptidase MepM/ murein hydrolase activator NlpD|nr:M23 family metallopeptidase [Spirochaetaceae bacterium]